MAQEFDSTVRYTINKYILENGFAPRVHDLAATMHSSDGEIKNSLSRLSENHGIVLHPNSFDIWVAHPFANYPTAFWVRSGRGAWWANCAWCSLGIAALLGGDATIITRIGAQEESVQLDIRNGRVSDLSLVTHFLVPASSWWENVIYTCSTILFFKSEGEVDTWCKNHGVEKGAVITVEKTWELAKVWYGDYLNPNWRRKTLEEVRSIFNKLGLTGSSWRLRDGWK